MSTSASMPITEAEPVRVAVGVIRRGNQILIAKRPAYQHKGGLWEFPGGKIDEGETAQHALVRELNEELGIRISDRDWTYLFQISWSYAEKNVLLEIFLVSGFEGDPQGKEGQEICWVDEQSLSQYQFPEANQAIVKWVEENSVS